MYVLPATQFSAAPSPPTSFEIHFNKSLFTENQWLSLGGQVGNNFPKAEEKMFQNQFIGTK